MIDLLLLVLLPGFIAVIFWSPILIAARFRSLFQQLPPTQSVAVSYLLVAWGFSLPFVLGTGILLTTVGSEGAALSNAVLDLAIQLTVVYIVALPVLAGIILPRIGINWDPSEYGIQTWIALLIATIWYCIVFVVPIAFLAFVLALPTG